MRNHKIFRLILVFISFSPFLNANNFSTQVMEATFKLFNVNSTSTCFIIESEEEDLFLVTAAHSLERASGNTALIVLRKPHEDGSYSRLDVPLLIRKGDTPLWVQHEDQDVAVLKLNKPFPVTVSPLPIAAISHQSHLLKRGVEICDSLFLFTFPERFEANGAAFPVARQGIFSSPPQLPYKTHPTYLADFTTFSGDSGGPAFVVGPNKKKGSIVGVVIAKHFTKEKVSSKYFEQEFRHSLGFGVILHGDYILSTLRKAMK